MLFYCSICLRVRIYIHTFKLYWNLFSQVKDILHANTPQRRKHLKMCRQYTITNSCKHSRRETRLCYSDATCNLTHIALTMPHFCEGCNADTMKYLIQDGLTLEHVMATGAESCIDSTIRAFEFKMAHKVPIPDGRDGPFRGRITREDNELLQNIEKVIESQMRKPGRPRTRSQVFLMHLHRSIERAEMDFLEDEFLVEINLHRQRRSLPIPELFAQVDVMDLVKDERDYHVCMEEYVSRKEEDREEEKPCKLPCGHVLGKSLCGEGLCGVGNEVSFLQDCL